MKNVLKVILYSLIEAMMWGLVIFVDYSLVNMIYEGISQHQYMVIAGLLILFGIGMFNLHYIGWFKDRRNGFGFYLHKLHAYVKGTLFASAMLMMMVLLIKVLVEAKMTPQLALLYIAIWFGLWFWFIQHPRFYRSASSLANEYSKMPFYGRTIEVEEKSLKLFGHGKIYRFQILFVIDLGIIPILVTGIKNCSHFSTMVDGEVEIRYFSLTKLTIGEHLVVNRFRKNRVNADLMIEDLALDEQLYQIAHGRKQMDQQTLVRIQEHMYLFMVRLPDELVKQYSFFEPIPLGTKVAIPFFNEQGKLLTGAIANQSYVYLFTNWQNALKQYHRLNHLFGFRFIPVPYGFAQMFVEQNQVSVIINPNSANQLVIHTNTSSQEREERQNEQEESI